MIDWHCHILPGMDDGSKSVDESLTMLRMLSEQGTQIAVATPHFYANDESVEDFIERRQKSVEDLRQHLSDELPNIVPGAEVRYYHGIGKLSELSRLCFEGSKLLLLEMPMEKWTDYTIRELGDISNTRNIKLILAHIERYLPMQSHAVWNTLHESGILMQVNASFFLEFLTKRKALSLLQSGGVHLIGSDCHNTKYRPPQIGKALENIKKKFGDEFVTQFTEYGNSVLSQNQYSLHMERK